MEETRFSFNIEAANILAENNVSLVCKQTKNVYFMQSILKSSASRIYAFSKLLFLKKNSA